MSMQRRHQDINYGQLRLMHMGYIFVYITNKDEAEAEKISKHLLKKKLAACVNIFPIKSMYWWKGKLVNDKETVCIVKTKKEHWQTIQKEVKRLHSYDYPCMIKIDVEGNKEY